MSARWLNRCLVFALVLLGVTSVARAGSVTAATKALKSTGIYDPTATFSVYAYSESKGQKNTKIQTNYPFVGGNGLPNVYNTEFFSAPLPGGNQKLSPIVGHKDSKKDTISMANYGVAWVRSITQNAEGEASVYGSTAGVSTELHAKGNTTPGAQSIGAGKAVDPFTVAPGVYDYSYSLSFSMQVFPTDPYASLYADAVDTNHVDPLWFLSIVAYGPISSLGDLSIQFSSDPSLGLSDSSVLSSLASAISISNGVASLSDFTLFDTSYYVSSSTTYSDSVAATTASVPEPSALMLGLAGALLLWAFARLSRPG